MKKKVLIFIPQFDVRGGGAPKVGSSLAMGLADNYDIYILTLFHFEPILPYKGKYYTLNTKHYYREAVAKIYQMQKIIKSISPDIIISFMNYTSFWIIPAMYFL